MPKLSLFVACVFLIGCARIPVALTQLEPSQRQAVLVGATKKHYAKVSLWEKDRKANWKRVYTAPGVIGRNGLAPIRQKKEGDGRTPSGIFALKQAFGYGPVLETGLDYRPVIKEDIWIDDAAHSRYNTWVKAPTDAKSFEYLRRDDHQYKVAAVIEYNTDPVIPGDGSAIFMHIWKRYNAPTAGCVAMSEFNIRRILKHLDKSSNPVIILVKDGYPAV